MTEQATLRDVAERAGVSVRTVSNVVTTPAVVAPATRARVLEAIAALGYRPNPAARQLRSGRPEVVGLAVPELDSPYFAELAAHLARAARERGWRLDVEQTDGDPERERAVLEGAGRRGLDGVVLSPWSLSAPELSRPEVGPPVVMLGELPGLGVVDHVAVDNRAAGREATGHLLRSGCRRIAVVGVQPHLHNRTAALRLAGHRSALADAGLASDPALELDVERLHRADGHRALTALLDAGERVDGVFCLSDQLAAGAVRALADRGHGVPHDVAVVGFDDVEESRYAVPSLTTVAPDKRRIADLALRCLAERMAEPTLPARDLQVAHRLVVRESAPGPAPARTTGSRAEPAGS